jgi:hypothetical protein
VPGQQQGNEDAGQIRLSITAAVPSSSPKLDCMSLNTSQPFTRAEALAAGLTDVDLRSRHLQRLFYGLYLRSGIKIGVQQMAAAALHISPRGSYASHQTAAALWGASIGDLDDVHVSVPKGSSRSERRGIVAHRATTDQNPRPCKGLLVSLQRVRLAMNERGWRQRSRRIPAEWHRLFTDRPVAQ